MLVRITLALVTALGTTAALAAPAATPATRETLKTYCTGDYLNYCSDYTADTPELKACFKQNNARLTPDCRAAIVSYTKAQKRG